MIEAPNKPARRWVRPAAGLAAVVAVSAATGWGVASLAAPTAAPDTATVRAARTAHSSSSWSPRSPKPSSKSRRTSSMGSVASLCSTARATRSTRPGSAPSGATCPAREAAPSPATDRAARSPHCRAVSGVKLSAGR